MMKHSYIRSFHASHQLNLQPMDNEREYLPWMSDCLHTQSILHFHTCDASANEIEQDSNIYRLVRSKVFCAAATFQSAGLRSLTKRFGSSSRVHSYTMKIMNITLQSMSPPMFAIYTVLL
jgi:hypothetical protein